MSLASIPKYLSPKQFRLITDECISEGSVSSGFCAIINDKLYFESADSRLEKHCMKFIPIKCITVVLI